MTTPEGDRAAAEPVLAEERDAQPGAETEVRVQQRLVGDRDRRRAEQQRDEVEHREHTPVALAAGQEGAESMLTGVWTAQDTTITRNVTQSACGSAGIGEHRPPAGQSGRDDRADAVPLVKLRSSTPTSGMTAKATKNTSAGSGQPGDRPVCRARELRRPVAGGGTPGGAAQSLADDLVHVVGELLRRDRQLEQLGDVVQQGLGRGRADSAWSQDWAKTLALAGDVVDELRGSRRPCEAPQLARVPLTTGTPPVPIHCLISSSESTAVVKNFLAISFCSSVAFEEIDRYWAGLPTVSLGSPLPPSTGGKFM